MEEMVGMKMAPPISLKGFLLEYKEILKNDVKEMDDLYDTDVESLEDEFALAKLEQDDDPYVSEFNPSISGRNRACVDVSEKAFGLQTYKSLNDYKKTVVRNPFQRTRYSFKAPDIIPKNTPEETDVDIENDLLIWVRVYRPARATHIGQSLESPVFAEEFVCLGSNLLTELRDKISCICNGKRFFDISEDPNQPVMGKETDPAYFFITDTFYNDMRNPNNADYSKTVITWAKTAAGMKNIKFKVAKMEETRFIDLTVSMGFPQQYQHHGNCEHIFTFSQVELLTSDTKLFSRSEYPFLMSFNFFNSRICNMCSNCVYSFVVEGSDRQLHEPAYLCEKCFMRYHYVGGKKIGQFRAYRIQEFKTNFDDDLNNDSDNISETNDNGDDNNEDGDDDENLPSTSKAAEKKRQSKKNSVKKPINTKEKEEVENKPKKIYKKRKTEEPEKSNFEDSEISTLHEELQEDEMPLELECNEKKKRATRKKPQASIKKTGTIQKKRNSRAKAKNPITKELFVDNADDSDQILLKETKSGKIIQNADGDFEVIAEINNTSLEDAKCEEIRSQYSLAIVKCSEPIDNDDALEFIVETPLKAENNHKMILRHSKLKLEKQDEIDDEMI